MTATDLPGRWSYWRPRRSHVPGKPAGPAPFAASRGRPAAGPRPVRRGLPRSAAVCRGLPRSAAENTPSRPNIPARRAS